MDLSSCPTAATAATESPQSSGDTRGSGGHRRSNSQQGNSGSPGALAGKSFKEVHAERNKQAQRRFRQRQKVRGPFARHIRRGRHCLRMHRPRLACMHMFP